MSISPIFIGIAGGSGAGKSTVCYSLVDRHPSKFSIVHLDDYHKKKATIPLLHGLPNWDHPDAIDFHQLIMDLSALKHGEKIIVQTKNERFNPNAKEIGRIPMEILPREIILVEGYLALWNPIVRSFFSASIFLDLPSNIRMKRRTKFIDPFYQEKILFSMHELYVEPTKEKADIVISVDDFSSGAISNKLEVIIQEKTGVHF